MACVRQQIGATIYRRDLITSTINRPYTKQLIRKLQWFESLFGYIIGYPYIQNFTYPLKGAKNDLSQSLQIAISTFTVSRLVLPITTCE
jgi:hypothetical protein